MKIQFEKLISEDLKVKEDERVLAPRNYLYASEVGRSFLEVFYSIKATPPTNPADDRALRTMMVGHIFEDYVNSLLPKDIKIEREVPVELKLEGMLPIHGRVDFIIDGTPVELKTVNSRSFWYNAKGDKGFKPYEHHVMQLMIYMLALKVKTGVLVYISKDDATIEQVNVEIADGDELYKKMVDWVKKMTEYLQTNTLPEPDPIIIMEGGKYKANWNITRSKYFTLITGKKDPHEVELEANRMNYKLKKESLTKPLTEQNNES